MPLGGLVAAGITAAGSIGGALIGAQGGGGAKTGFFRTNPALRSQALGVTPFREGQLRGFDVSFPGLQQAVGGFQSANLARAQELRGFLPQLRPGFGALTEARVGAVQRARQARLSDLRGEAIRRRIAGSSFAQNLQTQAEAEFGAQEAEVRAQSFLEELQATLSIIDQASQASIASAQAAINAMQFQAEIGTQFATRAATNSAQIAQTTAQIAAENAQANAAGFGAFGAQLGTDIAALFAKGGLFGGQGSGPITPPPTGGTTGGGGV